jgi:hypothetical protein
MVCKRCGTVFCVDTEDDSFWLCDKPALYCSKTCRKRSQQNRHRREARHAAAAAAVCARNNKSGSYPTSERARQMAGHIKAQRGVELRPYECPGCGFWHLTSDLTGETQAASGQDPSVVVR